MVAVWILVRAEDYSPQDLVRTCLLLALPLLVSGVLYVFAGGMEAGTWPPARFRESVRRNGPVDPSSA